MPEEELYSEGIESASKTYAVAENLVIVITIGIGFAGMVPLLNVAGVPILSIAYVLFLAVMLGPVLRKHLCTHCYYHGRWCHFGWGRLASRLGYAKGSGNKALGGKLAGLTWGILMAGPILAMIVGIVLYGITVTSGVLLGAFVLLSLVNFGLHVKDCGECKMRYTCAMSPSKR